jgi:hypothetical protein
MALSSMAHVCSAEYCKISPFTLSPLFFPGLHAATPAGVLKLLEFCNSCYIATSSDLETSASMVLFHSDLRTIRQQGCFYPGVMDYARETVFIGFGLDDNF